jgi:hypothetical protein
VADWNQVTARSSFEMGQSLVLFLPVKANTSSKTKARARAKSNSGSKLKNVKRAPSK